MTTKPPPSVVPSDTKSLESIAYAAVSEIPTPDQHDQDRLGYNVWRWLVARKDPLEMAVRSAGARMDISEEEALQRIRKYLAAHNITENPDKL